MLGPSPGRQVTDAHAAGWFRQVSRIPHQPALNAGHYVDDHALAQIPAALPLLGLPREQQMQITRGDGICRTTSARSFAGAAPSP